MTKFRPQMESLDQRINPANPHFISASSAITGDGALVANFKLAGLGDNETITITVTGDATAEYQWFNKGGNKPQGQPFQSPPVEFEASGDFTSGKNGHVTGTLTVQPPPPSQEFLDAAHSPNWIAKGEVSYTNIVISGGGDTISVSDVSGTFTLDT